MCVCFRVSLPPSLFLHVCVLAGCCFMLWINNWSYFTADCNGMTFRKLCAFLFLCMSECERVCSRICYLLECMSVLQVRVCLITNKKLIITVENSWKWVVASIAAWITSDQCWPKRLVNKQCLMFSPWGQVGGMKDLHCEARRLGPCFAMCCLSRDTHTTTTTTTTTTTATGKQVRLQVSMPQNR